MAKKQSAVAAGDDPADLFMENLEHPHKAAIAALRQAIKAADSCISEEIKWNASSFKLEEHFATFKLHPPKNIQLVLHRGAKPKPVEKPFVLDDPHGLANWKAPDRCVLVIQSSDQAFSLKNEIVSLVQQWISQL